MNPKQTAYQQRKFDNRNQIYFIIAAILILVLIISGATSCVNKTATAYTKDANKINPYQNNQHQEKPYLGGKVVNDKGEQITGANSYILGSQSVASGDVTFDTNFNLQ